MAIFFPPAGWEHGEGSSTSWRQKRRRTDPQTSREKIDEEKEDDDSGLCEQEYVPEEGCVESQEDYYYEVEEDDSGFQGDYGEEVDSSDDDEEEEDGEERQDYYEEELIHEYNNEDGYGKVPRDEDDKELLRNYAVDELRQEQEQEQEQERDKGQGEKQEHREEAGDDNGSNWLGLPDLDILDCLICYKPLDIPAFQCRNGHASCSSCRTKINNICAFCRSPTDCRNRHTEFILEFGRAKCKNTKYGCKEVMIYSKKHEHEKTCLYEPCSCPHPDCDFVGSSKQLYQHFSLKHSAVRFSYNTLFHITLNADDKSFILQEEKDNVLFILNNSTESYGNLISVSCLASKSDELPLDYDLQARVSSGIHTSKFQSITVGCQKLDDGPPLTGFYLVPSYFFSYNGQFELDIRIWRSVMSTSGKHSCK